MGENEKYNEWNEYNNGTNGISKNVIHPAPFLAFQFLLISNPKFLKSSILFKFTPKYPQSSYELKSATENNQGIRWLRV